MTPWQNHFLPEIFVTLYPCRNALVEVINKSFSSIYMYFSFYFLHTTCLIEPHTQPIHTHTHTHTHTYIYIYIYIIVTFSFARLWISSHDCSSSEWILVVAHAAVIPSSWHWHCPREIQRAIHPRISTAIGVPRARVSSFCFLFCRLSAPCLFCAIILVRDTCILVKCVIKPMLIFRFNKGRSSKFRVGSRVRQTPEEGRRTYRPKRCGNNNKDKDNSPKTLHDENVLNCFSTRPIIILILMSCR